MRRPRRPWFIAAALLLALIATAGWFLYAPAVPLPAGRGTLTTRTAVHNGTQRQFLLYVPPDRAGPAPVVLVLHGSGATGERMRRATAAAFEPIADATGALVVYPDGLEAHWHDCRTAGDNPARRAGSDDVGFLRGLVATLGEDPALAGRTVDSTRVYAFGFSNGGHMALRLALEAPDFVAAVAAVAAALPTATNNDCRDRGVAVPVLLVAGDADPVSPYAGGEVALLGFFGRRGPVRPATESAAWLADRAGHLSGPFEHRYPDEDPADGSVAMRQVWATPGLPEVALMTVYGGGHTIPHPAKTSPRLFGRTNHDLNAVDEAWRFFARQAPLVAAATRSAIPAVTPSGDPGD